MTPLRLHAARPDEPAMTPLRLHADAEHAECAAARGRAR
jgi:hypothetical protein